MGILDRFTKTEPNVKKAVSKKKTGSKAVAVVENTPATAASTTPKNVSVLAARVFLHPLVTEKSAIAESHNTYSFVIRRSATKRDVARAFLELYGAKAVSVRVMNVDGRVTRFGKSMGRRSDYKKALITVKAGTNVNIHEGV